MSRTKRARTKTASSRGASSQEKKRNKQVEVLRQRLPYRDLITDHLTANSTIVCNIGQRYIITTKNSVRLSLMKRLKGLKKKHVWTTPLALFISFTLTLTATKPEDYIFGAAVWEAIFILGTICSFCWLALAAIYTLTQARKSKNVDEVIDSVLRDLGKGRKSSLCKLAQETDRVSLVGDILGVISVINARELEQESK